VRASGANPVEVRSMPRLFRLAGLLLLAVALVVPAASSAQDKKTTDGGDPPDKTKPKSSDKDIKNKLKVKPDWKIEFIGKITALEDKEDKALTLTVQVTNKVPERNMDAEKQLIQQQQQLAQHQTTYARAKTAQERANAAKSIADTLNQIEQTKTKLITYKDVNTDVKLQAIDGTRYRYLTPPTMIDDSTGEFIKMSKDQLEKAKGTEGYPGYTGDTKGLKVGQVVHIFLWKDAKMPKDSVFADKKTAPKKVDDIQDELNNFRYDMIMLLVIADPPKAKS
jgi:hypothetical protein